MAIYFRKLSCILVLVSIYNISISGQYENPLFTTTKPTLLGNIVSTEIASVLVFEKWTGVIMKFTSWADNAQFVISPKSVIRDYYDNNNIFTIVEFQNNEMDKAYKLGPKGTVSTFLLFFEKVSPGIQKINIECPFLFSNNVYTWKGVTINNPDNSPKTEYTEQKLKDEWLKTGLTSIEGIYENTGSENSSKYRLAVKNINGKYQLLYISGSDFANWKTGDIKANLDETATPAIYKAKWLLANKAPDENVYLTFEPGLFKVIWTLDNINETYLKLYPTAGTFPSSRIEHSSGTGFAISSDGMIVTNFHVIEGATNIKVRGINGQFDNAYNARVINYDKNNDLAIIAISDANFKSLGKIPYTLKSNANVGENIFVLGYPLRATMGDEIKLTTGVISSKTGFQGDITSYQISAPVQPGNSGGPLFDSHGNIIGIINAKHTGAENVTYSVKANYLNNLIEMLENQPPIQSINSLTGKTLSQQVETAKRYVYIIEIQ